VFGQLFLAGYVAMPLTANWIWPRLGTPIPIVRLIIACFVSLFFGVVFIRVYLALNASVLAAERLEADRRAAAVMGPEAAVLVSGAARDPEEALQRDNSPENEAGTEDALRLARESAGPVIAPGPPRVASALSDSKTPLMDAEAAGGVYDDGPRDPHEREPLTMSGPVGDPLPAKRGQRTRRHRWLVALHAMCMFFSWVSLIGASQAFSSNARVSGFPYKRTEQDQPADAAVRLESFCLNHPC
jgi:hypothetical protein